MQITNGLATPLSTSSCNSSYVGAMVTFSLCLHVDATGLSNRYDNKQSTEPLERLMLLLLTMHLHDYHVFFFAHN